MPLMDQINTIRTLHGQGKTLNQIAAATGLEVGDVESVVAGGLAALGVSPAGVSGGGVGSPVVHKLAFAHDTPDIATGHAIYTPAVDELLLDAWIDVDAAWNGTTPFADIGQAAFAAVDGSGLFINAFSQQGINLTGAADDWAGLALQSGDTANPPLPLSAGYVQPGNVPPTYNGQRIAPARFNTVEPLLVWVTQDGTPNGAAAGSTAGSAHLYLVTATPATS